jgi:hypothetical protein
MKCRATTIHCDGCTSLFPSSCFRWISLDERSNVGHFCFCRLRDGGIETPPNLMCSESCEYSKDGVCDDGGSGSDYSDCAFGTDCEVRLPSKNMTIEKQLCCVVSEQMESLPLPHFFQTPSPVTAGLWRTLRQRIKRR